MTRIQTFLLTRPLAKVVGLTVLFYLLFTLVALMWHDWDPFWFVWIGEYFHDLDPNGRWGYDGQFAYYIARDGLDATTHMVDPAYRLQRILLPFIVGLISFGNTQAIAWNLIGVNLVAIVATTYLLGYWLQKQGLSAWYALMYALYVGTFMAYSRDLNEPLAYALVAWGMVAWHQKSFGQAVLGFALSGLAKEQALLFPIVLGVMALLQRDTRAILLLSITAVPTLLWQTFLWQRLGVLPVSSGSSPGVIPLHGILSQLTLEPGRFSAFLFVMLPALLLTLWAIYQLWSNWPNLKSETAVWLLLAHALFVLLLPPDVYDHIMHAGRNATGLILATLFTLPLFLRPWPRIGLTLYWIAPTFVWLIPVLRWAPWLSEI